MLGSPTGVAYPNKIWSGSSLIPIEAHGCTIGRERWCEQKGKCVSLKDTCPMYAPGDTFANTRIQKLTPQEMENLNIAKAQVRMRRDMAKRMGVSMDVPGNPMYQTILGEGQLATVQTPLRDARTNLTRGSADQRIYIRDEPKSKILGEGRLAIVEDPAHHHISVQNPMYAPSLTIRETTGADYTQVVGMGQLATVKPPQHYHVVVGAKGVNTPGQGAAGSVIIRPVRKVLSPATQPEPISPLITKNTTAPIYSPTET